MGLIFRIIDLDSKYFDSSFLSFQKTVLACCRVPEILFTNYNKLEIETEVLWIVSVIHILNGWTDFDENFVVELISSSATCININPRELLTMSLSL